MTNMLVTKWGCCQFLGANSSNSVQVHVNITWIKVWRNIRGLLSNTTVNHIKGSDMKWKMHLQKTFMIYEKKCLNRLYFVTLLKQKKCLNRLYFVTLLKQKKLWSTLEYWDSKKYRWANAFRKDLAYIPKSSLAESSQAGMTAGGDKAISLVDAMIVDFGDSAKLDAKWENHKRR